MLKAIYYYHSQKEPIDPIVVIGIVIREDYINIIEALAKHLFLYKKGRNVNLLVTKDQRFIQFIGGLNDINNIDTSLCPRPIEGHMKIVGSYDNTRYGAVSIRRAAEKIAFILRDEIDHPPIPISGSSERGVLFKSTTIKYTAAAYNSNLASLIAYSYARIIHKLYIEDRNTY
jgi:hypothetical protein